MILNDAQLTAENNALTAFEDTILRKNRHYEVVLSWKENAAHLTDNNTASERLKLFTASETAS